MKGMIKGALVVLAAVGLAGCMSSMMVKQPGAAPAPAGGKAMVVFMRPSSFGGAIQASVYDTDGAGNTFIGIVSSKTKLAYQAAPGKHLFMVVGENGDFMNADLVAGKTYYALVSPRMGFWKARFSLLPIHNDATAKYSLKSAEFQKWMAETTYVVKGPSAEQWYEQNKGSIDTKQQEYLRKWQTTTPEHQAELTLHPDDGI